MIPCIAFYRRPACLFFWLVEPHCSPSAQTQRGLLHQPFKSYKSKSPSITTVSIERLPPIAEGSNVSVPFNMITIILSSPAERDFSLDTLADNLVGDIRD